MLGIALYQPDIPQNLGAIIRLCACFGASLHIIEPCGFVLDDGKIKRAGLDYIKHAKLIRYKSFSEFIKIKQKARLVAFSTKAEISYDQYQFQDDDILLFGRESSGITDEVREFMDDLVTIPMQNGMRSLNVAMSAAIGLSEAIRQTRTL